jgi:hypothetical protein
MTPTKLVTLLQQAFRAGPTAAKYAAILLLVLNVGSFPLMWHSASSFLSIISSSSKAEADHSYPAVQSVSGAWSLSGVSRCSGTK